MPSRPGTLVLLRHGESTANAEGLFTGVLDVPLSARGLDEARRAAAQIATMGLSFSTVFCSELARARDTAEIVARAVGAGEPRRDWRLNERNYGALTARSKSDVMNEYGPELFREWRRSVHTPPPPMSDALFRRLSSEEPFTALPAEALRRTESLADVIARVHDVFVDELRPLLVLGDSLVVVAHGNSLRALCAVIDQLDDTEVEDLNIPTGQPLLYGFTAELGPETRGGVYLNGAEALAAAAEVAAQGGT